MTYLPRSGIPTAAVAFVSSRVSGNPTVAVAFTPRCGGNADPRRVSDARMNIVRR